MPIASVRPSGVTVIETIVGAVTVRAADCVTPARLAVMFADPAATPVASPEASTVARLVAEELHETRLVMSALLPSL